ncbi:hypothetical protein CYMTET_40708 [Cymbomonas tetramitiformis]|uniref:Uncharacterized protein n=1 Tax=Cymbomonas tetramitiformis TaxID=36881 RepID=A0AAE0C9K1_9CHLO|nr:hypothetical protein CYMTET_40708 [Cymbomonas tetramitiformis]
MSEPKRVYLRTRLPWDIMTEKVDAIYVATRHRTVGTGTAPQIRDDVRGGKGGKRFTADGDVDILASLVVAIKNEFESAGLDMTVFNLDDPDAEGVCGGAGQRVCGGAGQRASSGAGQQVCGGAGQGMCGGAGQGLCHTANALCTTAHFVI